ncbi:MAG: tetratricopeptide (TPR) repeat protein [Paracoccaceae bacterium]|jgi:tetratricopeptide (TPR) repeat protein
MARAALRRFCAGLAIIALAGCAELSETAPGLALGPDSAAPAAVAQAPAAEGPAAPAPTADDAAEVAAILVPRMAIPENAVLDPELVAGPQAAEGWADLGVRLLRRRAYDSALRAFSRSLAADGVTERAVLGASASMHGLGRRNQALRLMTRAVRIWPENISVRNNLGVLSHELGHHADAERELRVALELCARSPHQVAMTRRVEANLGMVRAAIDLAVGDPAPQATPPDWDVATLGDGRYVLTATERTE